jgi:UDP-N-acetylglucosamine pyrophosphorylase
VAPTNSDAVVVALYGELTLKFEPGFIDELKRDINRVRHEIRNQVERLGALSSSKIVSLASSVEHELSDVENPSTNDVVKYDDISHLWKSGCDAIARGEVAFVVLTSDPQSRIDELPKAFMRLPNAGMTLMTNKLFQSGITTPEGASVQSPIWFMSSPRDLEKIGSHLAGIVSQVSDGVVFEQFESYRLTVNNRIVFNDQTIPDLYTTGDGDLGQALETSNVLSDFPNVKYCVVVKCDNVLASLDPVVLSRHIDSNNEVTYEIVEKQKNDKGGVIVWHDGKLISIDDTQLSRDAVEDASLFNTETFVINVDTLKKEIPWRWIKKRREIGTKLVVQFERSIQQYSELCKTEYVLVDRKQRYFPINTISDLYAADSLLNGNSRL